MRRFVLVCLLIASCRSSGVHQCSDDFVCPPELVCAPSMNLCVSADQLSACAGKMDGDPCMIAASPNATCMMSVCTPIQSTGPTTCGNGMLDPGESCDGAPPPGKSCLDFGLDAGHLGCTSACDVDLSDCRKIGWNPMKAPVQLPMQLVWGTSPSDVWAAYSPAGLLHYDGSAWQNVQLPSVAQPIRAMWGTGPNDLWISLPANGTALWHYDGTNWTAPVATTVSPVAIWGSAKNDFFLSDGDRLYHCDGSTVTLQLTQLMGAFSALWGSGPNDVFAVGIAGWVAHFDGSSWTDAMVDSFVTVWGTGAHDVWAGGPNGVSHFDGSVWLNRGSGGNIVGLWASSPADVFAIDEGSPMMPTYLVRHFDGTSWSLLNASGHSIWGSSARDVFLVGDGPILHYQGASWIPPLGPPSTLDVRTIWAGARNDVWFGGLGGLYHFDGSQGPPVVPPTGGLTPTGIWDSSPTNVYVAGCPQGFCSGPVPPTSTLFQGNAMMWTPVMLPTMSRALAVWGSGPNDVYVTTSDTLFHFDGSTWSATPMSSGLSGAIWGSGPNDVFAAALNGSILHFDGNGWTPLAMPAVPNVQWSASAISGTDPHNVWFAGGDLVAHWDGTSLSATVLVGNDLRAIWAGAPDDVFAAGTLGTLLHYDGKDWTPVRTPTTNDIYALAGFTDQLWVGGAAFLTSLARTAIPGP